MLYKETDMWVFLANGDSVYCATEKEMREAKESLENLYLLTGKGEKIEEETPPCYLIKEGEKHRFTKIKPSEDVYLVSDFDLLSGI